MLARLLLKLGNSTFRLSDGVYSSTSVQPLLPTVRPLELLLLRKSWPFCDDCGRCRMDGRPHELSGWLPELVCTEATRPPLELDSVVMEFCVTGTGL